jgi:hypothetical protein
MSVFCRVFDGDTLPVVVIPPLSADTSTVFTLILSSISYLVEMVEVVEIFSECIY